MRIGPETASWATEYLQAGDKELCVGFSDGSMLSFYDLSTGQKVGEIPDIGREATVTLQRVYGRLMAATSRALYDAFSGQRLMSYQCLVGDAQVAMKQGKLYVIRDHSSRSPDVRNELYEIDLKRLVTCATS